MNDIEKILMSSSKAELIETLTKELVDADKVIVVLIEDKDEGRFSSQVLTLGLENSYEAYGILEIARQDLQADD